MELVGRKLFKINLFIYVLHDWEHIQGKVIVMVYGSY
jgi:hypothetical protein